jgi:hypothetical protein
MLFLLLPWLRLRVLRGWLGSLLWLYLSLLLFRLSLFFVALFWLSINSDHSAG